MASVTPRQVGMGWIPDHPDNRDLMPSRLFIYYNERAMEGTVRQDASAQIRDGIKSVVRLGVCPEPEWPYSEPFDSQPSHQCYMSAMTSPSSASSSATAGARPGATAPATAPSAFEYL